MFGARGRIGGRANTDPSLGFPTDLEASWLHGSDGNPPTEVIDQVGMHKAISDFSWIIPANGRALDEEDVPSLVAEVANYDNQAGASRDAINEWSYFFSSDYGGDEILFPHGYTQAFIADTRESCGIQHFGIPVGII